MEKADKNSSSRQKKDKILKSLRVTIEYEALINNQDEESNNSEGQFLHISSRCDGKPLGSPVTLQVSNWLILSAGEAQVKYVSKHLKQNLARTVKQIMKESQL